MTNRSRVARRPAPTVVDVSELRHLALALALLLSLLNLRGLLLLSRPAAG
jgi:hypothetical protein